jgi:hypothetical protein
MTAAKLNLIHEHHGAPPKPLGAAGMALWSRITASYAFDDTAGQEALWQVCAAEDRRAELAAAIATDGAVIRGRTGPREHPALKLELATRAFIMKSIERLGLSFEPLRPAGRPPGGGLGITEPWNK